MVDTSTKKRISELDIATLLQRYNTMTILKLLQEIAYYAEPKMDWDELVKKTTTGITNAREYQLLWRHLAYRDSLLRVEDDAQLQDDDSDMECELESSPSVSFDAVAEAIAHVKVMAASYVPSESDIPEDSTVEAPLTINIPYGLHRGPQEPSDSYWASRGMNITFPVTLPKAADGLSGNWLASSITSRKRRKKWSAQDDEELIAAVKQHGECSWALIAKEEFEGERTASQLSQRWGAIRRRCDTPNSSTQSGLQRTEAQIAANRALSLAVGNRVPSKKVAVGTGGITGAQANGAKSGSSLQGQQQSPPVVQVLPQALTSVPTVKSRVTAKKTTANFTTRAELMVTANSVAAAACMSGLATAASVLKVEPGKNAASALAPKAEPIKNTSAASLPRLSDIISAPKAEPVKTASAVSLSRPSSILSVPKAEPVKSVAAATNTRVAGPLNIRNAVNGSPKHVISSSPSNKPNAGAGVTASCKAVGVQKEQTLGNRARSVVTTTLSPTEISTGKLLSAKMEPRPSFTPKKNQSEDGSCADKISLNKPLGKESSARD